MSEAIEALKNYRQADEDGVMCIVSRQAVDAAITDFKELQAENNRLRNAWISVDERLPEFNILVWAFLDGEKEHSGVRWVRRGAAEMIRNNFGGTRSTVHDEWDRGHYDAALKRIDADMAMVTHWQPIPKEPSE